ncbi:UNVERIFIED_CONTAM: hypothetical protein PYX00_008906 [Menopon gallinae]|uniref:Uncharacterized protein n=1 Tax=Menopon gallinae TaxID=328185 RepID=A0AAW2H989_9NEOP
MLVTERTRSRKQAIMMRFLRAVASATRINRCRNTAIREEFRLEQLTVGSLQSIAEDLAKWTSLVASMTQRL